MYKFARNTAKYALNKYLNTVENLSDEELAIVFGCAAVIYSQLIVKFGSGLSYAMTKFSGSELSVLGKSENAKLLLDIVMQTNQIIIDLYNSGNKDDSAGLELLNMTFRCMLYPELYPIGIEIWDKYQPTKLLAKNILINKREEFNEKGKEMGMKESEIEEKLESLDLAIGIIKMLRPTVLT